MSVSFNAISKESEILDLIDEIIFELDQHSNFIFLNEEAGRQWNKKPIDLLGKNFWTEFKDHVNSPIQRAIERSLKEKIKVSDEFISPLTNRWVSLKAIPSQAGVLVILSDIHEECESKLYLKEEQRRLKDAQVVGGIGSFEREFAEDKLTWSDELLRIYGLKLDCEDISFEKFLSFIHKEDKQEMIDSIQHTYKTGEPFNLINRIIRADGELRYVHRRAEIIKNELGIPIKFYGTVIDITEQKRAEVALKESKDILQSVFDASPDSICIFNTIYTDKDEVEDFVILNMNKLTLKTRGLTSDDVIGKKYSKIFPNIIETGIFDQLKKVALTGETADFEQWYENQGLGQWCRIVATKIGNLLIVNTKDITIRKKALQELIESNEFIAKISSTAPDLISILDVKTELLIYTNNEEFWLDYKQLVPGAKNMKDYQRALEMVHPDYYEIAKVFINERKLLRDGDVNEVELKMITGGWIRIRSKIFKRDTEGKISQILSITTNITKRKKTEEKLKEQLHFINQIAITLPDLLSVIELNNFRKFIYANREPFLMNGFSFDKIASSSLEERVNLIHTDYKEAVENYFENFTFYTDDQIQSLEYLAKIDKGEWQWFRVRGKVFKRDEEGRPTHCLNIVQNINEIKKAGEELAAVKLFQQNEILKTILNTQEEERKRIAESLHNGVGQLLYAIKIKYDSVKNDSGFKHHKDPKLELEGLLKEAIEQTRNISFQLTPQLLETFGLKVAIKSIADHFSSDQLYISYKFISDTERLHADVEIAVFRIVQELVNNIVKHSKASIATIHIEVCGNLLKITTKDNGQGFKNEIQKGKHSGIGMHMIENRVKLMNGEMTINSDAESGTKTSIVFTI